MGNAVTYEGAADVPHCGPMTRDGHSDNVFVGIGGGVSKGISREGDNNEAHLRPGDPCPVHVAPITTGSTTVFVNGKGCGRVLDSITGCTSVAEGSPTVFAGG